MIDLHLHSTCSDGSLTVAELLAASRAAGLRAISICDHDTLAAYDPPPAAEGLTVVSGIEISVLFSGGTCHVLGYHIDPRSPGLTALVASLHAWRDERNLVVIDRLQAQGLPVTLAEAQALSGGGELGRPHLARLLVEKGAVATTQEAFDRYLADGRPCYVPKERITFGQAAEAIHAAGGAAVLAHPSQLKLDPDTLRRTVEGWTKEGLDGLEVWYSSHTWAMSRYYLDLATRYGLCATAGSDFHGASKPDLVIGGIPDLPADVDRLLDGLAAAAERWR